MSDELKIKQAVKLFETFCRVLEKHDFTFEKKEEDFTLYIRTKGEDLPMDIKIHISPDILLATVWSILPLKFPKEKITEAAVAIAVINWKLKDGNFDLDITDGTVGYRQTLGFRESLISDELCEYMVILPCICIDDFNDKLFLLSKGMMTIEGFVSQINEGEE